MREALRRKFVAIGKDSVCRHRCDGLPAGLHEGSAAIDGVAVRFIPLGIGIGQGHGTPHVPFLVCGAQGGVRIEYGAGYQNHLLIRGAEILKAVHVDANGALWRLRQARPPCDGQGLK